MIIEKSEIRGTGYGDKHNWKRIKFNPSIDRLDRFSEYECKVCHAYFRHFYNITPDIFEAIKHNDVLEECGMKVITND